MTLTSQQIARADALQASHWRLQRLLRMTPGELSTLLGRDAREAAPWIRGAAECGVRAAQLCLGRMLLEGCGVVLDRAAACHWFTRAAGDGDPEALNMLGRCHENGWGVPIDLSQAARHYRASALGGHDWGRYNLANALFDGRGLARDQRAALSWYLRAALQGHARAMNLVGRCLEQGWGCARAPEEAEYWYRRSAQAGYFRAQFNHAVTLARRGLSRPAADWFWKAACGGDAAIHAAIISAVRGNEDPALRQLRTRVKELSSAAAEPATGAATAAARSPRRASERT